MPACKPHGRFHTKNVCDATSRSDELAKRLEGRAYKDDDDGPEFNPSPPAPPRSEKCDCCEGCWCDCGEHAARDAAKKEREATRPLCDAWGEYIESGSDEDYAKFEDLMNAAIRALPPEEGIQNPQQEAYEDFHKGGA